MRVTLTFRGLNSAQVAAVFGEMMIFVDTVGAELRAEAEVEVQSEEVPT